MIQAAKILLNSWFDAGAAFYSNFIFKFKYKRAIGFLGLVTVSLFLCYHFPVLEKNSLNLSRLLIYFAIASIIGIIKSDSDIFSLLKAFMFSLKKTIFSFLSLKFLLYKLIYLLMTLPLFLYVLGDYAYFILNFLLILNNLRILQDIMVNKDDKYLSKIWENYFYLILNDILMLGLIFIYTGSPYLLIWESFYLDYFFNSSEVESSTNNSDPDYNNSYSNSSDSDPNPNNSDPNSNNSNLNFELLSDQNNNDIIYVNTTLPYINRSELPTIYSDRLIIRPLVNSDIDAYHSLRSQPEAMRDSGRGRPDVNISETLNKLERLIGGDKDNIYFGIFIKNSDGLEGDLIGDGGVHNFKSEITGWPEYGYKFKKEFWGKGYATEFGKAFFKFWTSLPRKDVKIPVSSSSIDMNSSLYIKERLTAYTRYENLPSQNVLLKLGFQSFEGLKNGLINWRKII